MNTVRVLLVATLLASACTSPPAAERPATWATPLDRPGLPNLHQLSDELYRSAQPTAEGFAQLPRIQIKTVINLRMFHSDRPLAQGLGLTLVDLPVESWDLDRDEVERFLTIVTDRERVPALVHCLHGADRTGALSAIYRMVVQGWSRDEAIAELRDGGFGYHTVFGNLILSLQHLELEPLRQRFGRR